MEFLAPVMGETAARIVIIALVLLLAGTLGMLVIGLAMRLFGGRRIRIGESRGERAPRLAVPDALTIDARRKLVLVRRDNVEHLILVGGNTDIVVEPAIPRFTPNARRTVAASPQPAAVPPQTGAMGPGRPLATRSQRAVQAGNHAGAPGTSPADAGSPGPKGAASDRAPPAAAARPGLDKSMTPPMSSPLAAPGPQAEISTPAAAKTNAPAAAPAARPRATGSPAEWEGPTPRQPPSLGMEPAQGRPAQAAQPARPAQSARPAAEPSPSAPRVRPATRPTAAAAPPSGHPSAAGAPLSGQAAGGSSQPGSGAQTQARGEPRRGQPSKLAEGDPDMTALLGEIFGQNKH